jgi:hypothetical protein
MPKPIQHQIGEPKTWRSGCPDITGTHGDIKSQTPISGLGLTRDNLLRRRASNLGSSSAVDTQGSRVRHSGGVASLAHFGAGIASFGAGKKMASFETRSLTIYYLFRSIKNLWINLGLEKSAVGLSD